MSIEIQRICIFDKIAFMIYNSSQINLPDRKGIRVEKRGRKARGSKAA